MVSTFVCEIQYVENEENIDKWWIWMSHYHNEMDSSSTTAYVQTHVQCNILLPYGLQMSFFEILATYNAWIATYGVNNNSAYEATTMLGQHDHFIL